MKLDLQLSRELLREVMVPVKRIRECKYMFRIYDNQKMRQGQILQQIKVFLEQKNHPLKWMRWNNGLLGKLKKIKFEDKLFDIKFVKLIKEYEYVVEQTKWHKDINNREDKRHRHSQCDTDVIEFV